MGQNTLTNSNDMCGICGFVKFDRMVDAEDKVIVQKMNKKLLHRGPDAQECLLFENLAFGFSRLSIIGLGNGMQPITNEDDSLILICNGEVFNYIELKKGLISRGHKFNTHSDIEVIIHLYEEKGISFLNEINGQFAFALYDKKNKTLFCARDQMGIIPFFYTKIKDSFIFGSEIKAILEHPLVQRQVDMVGLDQVFTFAGLISPRTMFKNISSLENGHYLKVHDNGHLEKKEYWDLLYPLENIPPPDHSEQFYQTRLEELFDISVKMRLRADVSTGFYLSGGLDSTMIAMKIRQFSQQRVNQAFSIDFVESKLSESFYQNLVAERGDFELNKRTFYYNDISSRLQKAIYHCECPIKETYNTASLALSEAVRNKGVKVILSGEGSDELFAGYVGYRFDKIRAKGILSNTTSDKEKNLRKKVWGDTSYFYESNFSDLDIIKKAIYSKEYISSFEEFNCLNYPVINKSRIKNRDLINKRSYIDFKLRLVDHLVSDHGDRMALANSVEVRYPFLDKDLVEFSTKIPSALKLNGLTEKYILKKMATNFIPMEIVNREKFGFVAPGSPYLLQNNVEYVNDLLSYDLVKRQGYFNPDAIENLKSKYAQKGFSINAPFESDLLMPVITFGILLDTFF